MKKLDTNLKKNIIRGVSLFILFNIFDYFLIVPLLLLKFSISTGLAVVLTTLKNSILAFLLFFIYRKDLLKDWDKFKVKALDYLDTGAKYWLIGLVIMVVSNLFINLILGGGGAANEEAVQSYIDNMPLLMLISAGFLAPFVEEMIFRKSIRDIFSNKWVFAIVSGLIFGYMHVFGNVHSLTDFLYIIPYSGLGLSFALAYYKTENIFTSISLHMIHNTILILCSIIPMFL